MKRPDVQFCPFCGSDEKLGYEGFRLKCYNCGKLFEVKEMNYPRARSGAFS